MPTYHHVEQRTEAWLALRLGKPTASEFHRIVTPAGSFSKQSRAYAIRLVTETLLNRDLTAFEQTEFMERGSNLEPEAVKAYEFQTEAETQAIGFVTSDCGRYGASPDRLVGDAGLLEIKCPAEWTHVGYLLDEMMDKDYRPQVQGQLLVTGRQWVDWLSYAPEMPALIVRVPRDEEYIAKLAAALDEFCDLRDELLERARSRGLFAERSRILTPTQAFVEAIDAAGDRLSPLDAG